MLLGNLGPDTFGLDDNQLLIVEEKGMTKTNKQSKNNQTKTKPLLFDSRQ